MKLTNGYWMIRDGVNALYAREAYELNVGEDKESLNVLAPTSVVHGRYDTLNLPTFNIDVTAPAEGVIRVAAGHWQERPIIRDSLCMLTMQAIGIMYERRPKATVTAKWARMARAFRSRRVD